ncbi:hypothetical protein [Candidatus Nitrosocosmicus sp. T]
MTIINDCYNKRIQLFQGLPYMIKIDEKVKELNRKEKYFKDYKIQLDYTKHMTAEGFDKCYRKKILKEKEEAALF